MQDQPEFSSQERRAGVSPERVERVSPSESVPVFLPFPGTQNTPRQPERSPGEWLGRNVVRALQWNRFKIVPIKKVIRLLKEEYSLKASVAMR